MINVFNSKLNINFINKFIRMSNFSVYVTRSDIPAVGIELLKKKGYHVDIWNKTVPVPREELLKQIVGKNALYCLLTDKVDKEVIDRAGESLKVVSTMSVGYEHLDVSELKKKNIRIGYTPGVLTSAVAELTVALLLATMRRLLEANQAMTKGEWSAWSPVWMCGPSVKNSTIGIFGFGRIGQEIAEILTAFKPKSILYTNRSEKSEAVKLGAQRVEFDKLLSDSDVILITCALTPETKELFNKAAFTKMKKTAILINTSRGGVVNQEDLVSALKNGDIAAAGLDVMTPEPLPLDNPLFSLKNCILLPHIGSASTRTREEMAVLTANNIITALNNEKMPAELT